MMNQYTHANRILWNAWTKIHEKSQFYDIQAFKAGGNTLKSIELDELGDVRGSSLLHLQCHFGQDTLSWARLGAQVTGVDLSDEAISLARSLAGELGLKARFICSDIYELPQVLEGQFDIVFTSYGVLAWLSDLPRWAGIIANFLKPGGIFYIVEIHPYAGTLDDWEKEPRLGIRYPYFQSGEPVMFEAETSYAEPDARHTEPIPNYQWEHGLGEILTALLEVGLQIQFLHEFPMTVFKQLPFMEACDGWWCLPQEMPSLPLLFSLKAIKPA
jgi:SAM-dependent methyltransferase